MLKSDRGNRITNVWRCPHCQKIINTQAFRLDPNSSPRLICPNSLCAYSFEWKAQNIGRLWPEQRAYNVLRTYQVSRGSRQLI